MIKKGSIGLFMTMMLSESSPSDLHLKQLTKTTTAAHRSSPATADGLRKELSISQPP
jgi:hypothetical protein